MTEQQAEKFSAEVRERFGLLPKFFFTASSAPGLIEKLWGFARAGYLDNPLPSLFKERLFVHLSRFCEIRYCIVRHVGFLIGEGRPAGMRPHASYGRAGSRVVEERRFQMRRGWSRPSCNLRASYTRSRAGP